MSDASYAACGFREMVKSDLQGGTLNFLNAAYDCTVGTFQKQDMLVSGGITPMMIGDAQIALADLPADFELTLGLKITVIPNTGRVRQCQLHSTQNSGPLINLLLRDINEGA